MAAKFEVRRTARGFTWVVTSQGRTLATGEPHGSRAQAEKAIATLRKAVAAATVEDLTAKTPGKTVAKQVAKATKGTKAARSATTKRATKTTATKSAGGRRRAPRTR